MARAGFKRAWTRVVPVAAERSTYVAIASAQLAVVVWQWRPIDTVIWSVAAPARYAIYAVQALALALIVVSTWLTDHFDLFGLRQAWLGDKYTPVPFVERGLYRYVRHPMMLGMLVWLWAAPTLTVGHFVLSAGLSVYIAIGIAFEERSLERELGAPYADYRRRVPAIVPFTGPSPGSYPPADRRRTP